jgi:hypothetical protein
MNTNIAQNRLAPDFQARYRAESNRAPVSLRRKKCACGTTVTAKQLIQYLVCAKCVKAAA